MGRECEVAGKRRAKSVEGWWGWGKGEALRTLSVIVSYFSAELWSTSPVGSFLRSNSDSNNLFNIVTQPASGYPFS